MHPVTLGPGRYARAGALGMSVAAITTVGHVLGHGAASLVPMALVLGLSLAVAAVATSRELRPRILVPVVVGLEAVGHWLLSALGASATAVAGAHHGAPGASTGVVLQTVPGSRLPRVVPSAPAEQMTGAGPGVDLPMLGGHALAAALIVLLAWRADAALHAFEVALRRAVAVILGPGFRWLPRPVLGSPSRVRDPFAVLAPQPLCELPAWRLRGPPVLPATA